MMHIQQCLQPKIATTVSCNIVFLERQRDEVFFFSANKLKVIVQSQQTADVVDISGPNVATLFAEQAKKNLSTAEFQTLLQFLTRSPPTHDVDYLQGQISVRLEAFYTAEQELTAESPNILAGPSGPKNAEIGLIIHCRSKEGDIGKFWDMESRSLQPLVKKGLSTDFMFG